MDPVRFRDCACPQTPHPDGDTVTYHERLSFDASTRALKAIIRGGGDASAAWEVYLFDGPESWNLVDSAGRPLALTHDALEALPFEDQYEIADHADTVFGEQVLAPLVRRMNLSSKPTRTPSTSRRPRSSSVRTLEPLPPS